MTDPVLVVDDDMTLNYLLRRMLRRGGVQSVMVDNPLHALSVAATSRFSAIITDRRMPPLDGETFARRVRVMTPWVPILLITGDDFLVEPDLFDFVLVKGFNDVELLSALQSAKHIRSERNGESERVSKRSGT